MSETYIHRGRPMPIPFKRVGPDAVTRQLHKRAWDELADPGEKSREYFQKARDRVAILAGFGDFEELILDASNRLAWASIHHNDNADPEVQRNMDIATRKAQNLVLSRTDYDSQIEHFCSPVHAVIRILFQDRLRGLTGLHIASNFDPYGYYLRHVHLLETEGIDNNEYAGKYARENGFPVETGDPTSMPYKSDRFNFVMSNHFLCSEYLRRFIFGTNGPDEDDIMRTVVREAMRVLKPGGYFISYREDELDNRKIDRQSYSAAWAFKFDDHVETVFAFKKA